VTRPPAGGAQTAHQRGSVRRADTGHPALGPRERLPRIRERSDTGQSSRGLRSRALSPIGSRKRMTRWNLRVPTHRTAPAAAVGLCHRGGRGLGSASVDRCISLDRAPGLSAGQAVSVLMVPARLDSGGLRDRPSARMRARPPRGSRPDRRLEGHRCGNRPGSPAGRPRLPPHRWVT
jgi:hypothetical protein